MRRRRNSSCTGRHETERRRLDTRSKSQPADSTTPAKMPRISNSDAFDTPPNPQPNPQPNPRPNPPSIPQPNVVPGRSDGAPPLPPPPIVPPNLHDSSDDDVPLPGGGRVPPLPPVAPPQPPRVHVGGYHEYLGTPVPHPDNITDVPRITGRRGRPGYNYGPTGMRLRWTGHVLYGDNPNIRETPIEKRRRLKMETKWRDEHQRLQDAFNARGEALRGNATVEPHYLGPLIKCKHCASLNFSAEASNGNPAAREFSICCMNGKIRVPPIRQHERIQQLLQDTEDPVARSFQTNIRKYNTALGFASYQFNHPRNHPDAPIPEGPYVFWIHGVAYHYVSYPRPQDPNQAAFGQLYFLDPQQAAAQRVNGQLGDHLDDILIRELDAIIRTINPFARAYRRLREYEATELERVRLAAVARGEPEPQSIQPILMLFDRPGQNSGTHGADVTGSEIAAIYTTRDGAPLELNGIVVKPIDATPNDPYGYKIVPNISFNVDPLTYPLMRPYGTVGWYPNMTSLAPNFTTRKVTLREYTMYCLMFRAPEDGGSPLLNFGRLCQQYIVDVAHRIEQDKLSYIKSHQGDLRAMSAGDLRRLNDGDGRIFRPDITDESGNPLPPANGPHGVKVILPSAFLGSPRNMHNKYCDAMAMMTEFGKPDLFITFTTNTEWPEIRENLQPHMKAEDQVLLMCRVFHAKLQDFKNQLVDKMIFGRVRYYTYSIEFQKRGLPHAHFLIGLYPEDKLHTAEQVDACISAEIPNDDESHCHLVKRHMMHGPCGPEHSTSRCWKDGKCSKNFPKDFIEATAFRPNGYPIYRRRNNDASVMRDGRRLDNRWVVPYNKYLLERYNCHINVEHCTMVQVAKYIFKYIFKGVAAANVRLDLNNEVTTYESCRFLSSPEAAWHLAAFEMHKHSHNIESLPVHLEGEHRIYFRGDEDPENIRDKASKLIKWLDSNHHYKAIADSELAGVNDERTRDHVYKKYGLHLTYPQYVKMFSWRDNRWNLRQMNFFKSFEAIGRICPVNAQNVELRCLRLLLLHVTGCTSWNDVRTCNGIVYNTFSEAAIARGLIASDEEFPWTIAEALTLDTPLACRITFAIMLQFNNPPNAQTTWDVHKDGLSGDFVDALGCSSEEAHEYALAHINAILRENGAQPLHQYLRDVTIMDELPHIAAAVIRNNGAQQPTIEDITVILSERYGLLNAAQRHIFDTIVASLHERRRGGHQQHVPNRWCFFIDGPGGTGKTFLYETIYYYCLAEGFNCIVTAWTGIAASLLPTGRTVHATFRLSPTLTETTTCNIPRHSSDGQKLFNADIILWDECSMTDSHAFTAVNRCLQEITGCAMPFGNKVMVVGGDFRQILPVVAHGDRAEVVARSLLLHETWRYFQRLQLQFNERAGHGNEEFASELQAIGEGKKSNINGLHTFPARMCVRSVDALIERVFGAEIGNEVSDQCAILCPRHDACHVINDAVTRRMEGVARVYRASNRIVDETDETRMLYSDEFLAAQHPSGLPPHVLTLKKG
uniref:ATP-dependent DNA helicase n=1 Tax=Lutzomyia longipalpis TaxID=7200 RepID=A0A1B0CVT6_LUTLO